MCLFIRRRREDKSNAECGIWNAEWNTESKENADRGVKKCCWFLVAGYWLKDQGRLQSEEFGKK